MNRSDIQSRLTTIEDHIKNSNDFGKVNAYRSLQRILLNEDLKSSELEPFLKLFFKQFNDTKSFSFNELINTVCLIGQQNLLGIKIFLSKFKDLLQTEDIFLIKPILQLLATYSSSQNREIHDIIVNLLDLSTTKFFREDLQGAFQNFLEEAMIKGFGFLEEYKAYLQVHMAEYRTQMPNIYDYLSTQIKEYENYLIVESSRKAQIDIKIEKEQKKREDIRKRRAEIITKIESEQIQLEPSESDIKSGEASKDSHSENPNFISFSKMGLKKKKD